MTLDELGLEARAAGETLSSFAGAYLAFTSDAESDPTTIRVIEEHYGVGL